jgi:NAD(P)-dependent dehydrogenase (short-subunit alcohol dehydrogenase family)
VTEIDLTGRVAAITGGGHGIGEAIARSLVRAGARVVVLDIDAKAATRVADELRRDGGVATAEALDVTVSQVVDEALERLWTQCPIDIWPVCPRWGGW